MHGLHPRGGVVRNDNVTIWRLIHVLRKHGVAIQSKYLTQHTKYNTKGPWQLSEAGTWCLEVPRLPSPHLLPLVMSTEQNTVFFFFLFLSSLPSPPVLWGASGK